MKRIVVLGGGFAGLWSAVGAARQLDELGIAPGKVQITLVNRDAYHNIRVRNYESDLAPLRVPLDQVLGPVGVTRVEGAVSRIDLDNQTVEVTTACGRLTLPYDRLVLATGSQLARPAIPGLETHAFSVDTYAEAARLDHHLKMLSRQRAAPGRFWVLVVGAGLTGIETACEMTQRLRAVAARTTGDLRHSEVRVILADHSDHVGSDMGDSARPVIERALAALEIDIRVGIRVQAIDADCAVLDGPDRLPTLTTVWTAGMRASPLTEFFPVERDRFGRVPVDPFMRVKGVVNVFAAGDVAWAMLDERHPSVMSCQHARPMGRFAGHNVVCDLLGKDLLPLHINDYVTVLDLGPCSAVYTEGWGRTVISVGAEAKATKQEINSRRIYPPINGDRCTILAAAAPVVQAPPAIARAF